MSDMTAHPADPQGPLLLKCPCCGCMAVPCPVSGGTYNQGARCLGCSLEARTHDEWNRRAPAETPALDMLIGFCDSGSLVGCDTEIEHGLLSRARAELRALKGQP